MCTVVAAVLGAVGSLEQGAAAASAAKAQAAAAEQNARIAGMQATDAVKRGGLEEEKARRQMAILRGRQRTMAAAAGLDPDTGSMLDVQDASMREGERDIATSALNHAREAWGYQVQATNYRNEAAAARAAGSNAMTGGIFGAGTSLLSLAVPTPTGGSHTIKMENAAYVPPDSIVSWDLYKKTPARRWIF